MPTTSQSLLSKRSGESPLTTPRTPGTTNTMSIPTTSAVKSLTVTFPRVYLDQRHGHSTLRGEHGELFLDRQDVDKIVKRYIRTGDSDLHLPVAKFPRQFEIFGQVPDYKALHAREMLPVRRSEEDYRMEKFDLGKEGGKDGDEFDDQFCRSRPLITFLDSLTDDELQEHKDDYVYVEIDDANDMAGTEKVDHKLTQGAEQDQKILKLRKVGIPIEEGIMDEVYVDDSDMSRIKVYRIESGKKLIFVKDIEVGGEKWMPEPPCDKDKAAENEDETTFTKSLNDNFAMYTEFRTASECTGMSKDIDRETTLSFAEYLKESLHPNTSKGGPGTNKHSVKHSHQRKLKHKKTTTEKLSPRRSGDLMKTDPNMDMQFPQKPVLPGVSPRRDASSVHVTSVNSGRKGLNPHTSDTKSVLSPLSAYRQTDNGEDENGPFQMKEAGHEDSYKAEDGSSTASLSQSDLGVLSKENSLITTAESTGGLSRMQQLSVEKKLKSLEPAMYFYDPPSPRPLSMCFDYTGTNITHVQIRLAIMNTLENIPNAKVTSLQFVARNVILGTIWVDNRWIVGLSTKQCVTVLMGRGIVLNGEPIKLRKYDDIIKEEYDKFVQHKERFSKKGGKKSMKHTILPQTNALSLLDKSLQEPSMESPITEVSTETVDVSA